MLHSGDSITILAHKSDGTVYRWWRARVLSHTDDRVVTASFPGDVVKGPAGGWAMKHAARTVYWFDRPFNLIEMYEPDGRLKQVYVHIASPARLESNALHYTDLELDVVKRPGQPVRVVDEDEFCSAAEAYGYTNDFQLSCREAVEQARELARTWRVSGPPRRREPASSGYARTSTPAADSSSRNTDV